uniref:pancreatic progenitor cell differentiation and proliferation factor-like n=1 Tax=Jaculus jaculus TaxID=51337 RepID=UPI001E1B4C75|nr:pancreatic progenitor cell differentiation and proliferation factor-like [Jaculus jaculus]
MAAIRSSSSLVATHDYYWQRRGSTSSNSSSGSAAYPRDATVPHHPASSSGNPLSHSRPQCWSPLSSRQNPPRPPAAWSQVARLQKP